jgi:hypothetical protein
MPGALTSPRRRGDIVSSLIETSASFDLERCGEEFRRYRGRHGVSQPRVDRTAAHAIDRGARRVEPPPRPTLVSRELQFGT